MSVAVLIPWRPTGCVWRERALHRIRAHYTTAHPRWELVQGTCEGTWSKAVAVADALRQTDADVLVVADADSWVTSDALMAAVDAVASHGWAVPHRLVKRLDERATGHLYAGTEKRSYARPPYRGVAGGGITVVTRDAYDACPLDPRFLGWGGEDVAWGWALNAKIGPAWRGVADLWHLWHPSDHVGYVGGPESKQLVMRWRMASRRQGAQLDAMIDEAKGALCARP